MVSVQSGGRTIEGPVWVFRGQSDAVVSLTLGYGRRVAGQLSAGLGYDAFALRRSDDPWMNPAVTLRRSGAVRALATTQEHTTMEGHDFVRVQRLGAAPVGDGAARPPTLYPDHKSDGRAWGMVIDLDACIGCNACVTACQAENNIAVVGRDEVLNGPRDALAARRSVPGGARTRTGARRGGAGRGSGRAVAFHAGAVHALRAGALRSRLSGGGHAARP